MAGEKIGGKTVLSSGTLVSFKGLPVEINLDGLPIALSFVDDQSGVSSFTGGATPSGMAMTFLNFSNTLGTAVVANMGQRNGQPFYGAFCVTAIGDNGYKIIQYSLIDGSIP